MTTFLIRGFDPLEDAIDYGRELIPAHARTLARVERVAALNEGRMTDLASSA